MLKINKTPQSIRISKDGSTITIVRTNKAITFHQSIEAKDVKHATQAQMDMKKLIDNMDSKTNYQKRFSKLATSLNEMGAIPSFRGLSQRLNALT